MYWISDAPRVVKCRYCRRERRRVWTSSVRPRAVMEPLESPRRRRCRGRQRYWSHLQSIYLNCSRIIRRQAISLNWIIKRFPSFLRIVKWIWISQHLFSVLRLFVCLFVSSLIFHSYGDVTIEQWGFFNVPHPLRHGLTVYNGHLRRPVTLPPVAERLAWELSLPVFKT